MSLIENLLKEQSEEIIDKFGKFIWSISTASESDLDNILSIISLNDFTKGLFRDIYNNYNIKCLGSNLKFIDDVAGDMAVEGKSFILSSKNNLEEVWKFDLLNGSYDVGITIVSDIENSLYRVKEFEKVVIDYEKI